MHVFLGTLITDDIGLAKQENKNPQAARIHNNVVRRIRQNFQVPSFENQSFPAILFFFFFFFFFGIALSEVLTSTQVVQQALQDAGRRVVRKKRRDAEARVHLLQLKNDMGKVQEESRQKVLLQEIRVLTRELKSRRNDIRYLQYQSRQFQHQCQRQQ